MKDYTNITGLDKETFMTGVSVLNTDDGKRYQVSYANGDVESNVEYSIRNEIAINKRLEEQADATISSKEVLVRRQKQGFIGSIVAGTLGGVASLASSFYVPEEIQPVVLAIGAGLLCVGGILGYAYKRHMQPYIDEVSDLELRADKQDDVKKYLISSPNAYLALDGQSDDEKIARAGQIADMIAAGKDPLSLISLETGEGLSDTEVKQLIKRDVREQQLGLTYTDGYSIWQAASHK